MTTDLPQWDTYRIVMPPTNKCIACFIEQHITHHTKRTTEHTPNTTPQTTPHFHWTLNTFSRHTPHFHCTFPLHIADFHCSLQDCKMGLERLTSNRPRCVRPSQSSSSSSNVYSYIISFHVGRKNQFSRNLLKEIFDFFFCQAQLCINVYYCEEKIRKSWNMKI